MAKDASRPGIDALTLRLPSQWFTALKKYSMRRCNTVSGAANELIYRGLLQEGYTLEGVEDNKPDKAAG